MHRVTGNREDVLNLLNDTIRRIGESKPAGKKSGAKALSVGGNAKSATERAQLVDILKRGHDNEQPKKMIKAAGIGSVPQERAVDSWYAPRNRAVAVFQAVMDEYLDERLGTQEATTSKKKKVKGASIDGGAGGDAVSSQATLDLFYEQPVSSKKKAGKTIATDIFEKFNNVDPGWAEVVYEKTKALLKGKHKFISHTSVTDFRFNMNDETTIAIVGDWGGGNAAAQAVAKQIAALRPDHVIHLGDVYYAGTPKEVKERFLKYWPAPPAPGKSFALNSNHEMYSGGYGYFDVALKEFKQPASYFSLANNNWRFIGLDTGYIEHDLNNEQVQWLTGQFKGKNQKTILLSHHQLFSAYENTNANNLRSRVQPFLDAKQIYGWIWGHEHLCVAYEDHLNIKARCLGNGCFPYNLPENPPQIPVKWIDNRPQANDPDYRGTHTFGLLRIKGAQIDIDYIDQDGQVGYSEQWS
jgi:hypothetical protein